MKTGLHLFTALTLLSTTAALWGITAVYAYNKTALPVSFEVTLHYYQKKVAVPDASGVYSYTVKPVDETKAKIIPAASSRVTLAENTFIDRIIVHKAWIAKSIQTILLPIEQTFSLAIGQAASSDISCAIVIINPDFTFSIMPSTAQCVQNAQ